jgi:hypothetical protein
VTAGPVCFNGGYVGGPHLAIPDDPTKRRVERDDLVGCNRLRCTVCESPVKHVDRRRLAVWMTRDENEAFYADKNPAASRFVGEGGAGDQFRTYYCRCQAHDIAGLADAGGNDWGYVCAGHPAR